MAKYGGINQEREGKISFELERQAAATVPSLQGILKLLSVKMKWIHQIIMHVKTSREGFFFFYFGLSSNCFATEIHFYHSLFFLCHPRKPDKGRISGLSALQLNPSHAHSPLMQPNVVLLTVACHIMRATNNNTKANPIEMKCTFLFSTCRCEGTTARGARRKLLYPAAQCSLVRTDAALPLLSVVHLPPV